MVAIMYDGIAFLAANGDGTFQDPIYSDSTFQLCCQLVASDVSGDGKLDLVNVNAGSGVVVMLGNGDGTFQAPATYGSPGQVLFGNPGRRRFQFRRHRRYWHGKPGRLYRESRCLFVLERADAQVCSRSLNFGTEPIRKTAAPKKITLTNSGNGPLKLSIIIVAGDFLQTNNCGKRREIGKSCTIEVSFKPKSKGVRTRLVRIADNTTASPQTVHLKGTGD